MSADTETVALTHEDEALLARAQEHIDRSLAKLRDVVPCILDMSAREATLSSLHGHTLKDKIELFELARDFGLRDIGLSNFFDFPSVTDQFLDYLVDNGISLDGFLATIAVEPVNDDEPFPMGPAARRTEEYGIPNVILLVEIAPSVIAGMGRQREDALRDLNAHVERYRRQLPPETERRGRIYVRIGDAFDAFDEDPAFVLKVFKLLGQLPITGILFEDVRGTRFIFESNELIRMMRHYNPAPRKILVHPHSGNGMEDATTIEAVLAGADGIWSGFTPQAAQGGHGSVMMFLTNLMRARNRHVVQQFDMERLRLTAERMWQIHDRHGIPPNTPLVGARAYRYVDQLFEQRDRPCDLEPHLIGVEPGYQVTPSWAPPMVIGERLKELGYGPEVTEHRRLLSMIRACINAELMEGRQARFDDPDILASMVETARDRIEQGEEWVDDSPDPTAALTARYR